MNHSPVLFVGHGNPMNGLENNEFWHAWPAKGYDLPRPEAILCISAHWESEETNVTDTEEPKTIYAFFGVPQELQTSSYPALGLPELTARIQDLVKPTEIGLDQE
jgi:4,5-DOPA dioxygenase extradiol